MRVGCLVSHPIQYYSPWFRALAKRVDLHVFYAHRPSPEQQGEGFGQAFEWNSDLLSGYEHSFLVNRSRDPGTHHFSGCDTPEIATIIRHGSFDLFIVFGWFLRSYWQAVRACRKSGVPILVRGDSQLNTDRSSLKRAVKRITHRNALRHFDGFLSVGQRNREYLKHYGVSEKRIFFVPHFVDNDWFARLAMEARPRRREIRARWGADDTTFVLLFAGKFIPTKRPTDLLKAVEIPCRENARVLAVFVGAGELENDLRQLAASNGIPACFEGFRNQAELPECYVSADALVLPSSGETWGLVVNEAMACGLPAIVSDAVGCAPDLIDEESTGFIFPVGDIVALAQRIARASELTNAGFNFRRRLECKLEYYSVESAVDGALSAFAKVARLKP
jgi:glycosyltransferase involved in cell wall biosynthesis